MDKYMIEGCGIGRVSRINDLKHILEYNPCCESNTTTCIPKQMLKGTAVTWEKKYKFRNVFPSLVKDEIKFVLISLFFYFIFIIISTVVILHTCMSMYWLTNVIQTEFYYEEFDNAVQGSTDFYGIRKKAEFWLFLDSALYDSTYWTYWYDSGVEKPKVGIDNLENKLLGIPRFRQLRVRNNSCKFPSNFQNYFHNCYGPYSYSNEDHSSFGNNDTIWKYHSSFKTGSPSYKGEITTYDGGGFIEDLSLDRQETRRIIKKLKDNLWISRNSRILTLEFTVYNENVNFFCIFQFVFELPPTGGIITHEKIYTVKLIHYHTKYDYFILACQWIFLLFLIYYTIEAVLKMIKFKTDYFLQGWHYVELAIILFGYLCTVLHIYTIILANEQIRQQRANPKSYVNFTRVGYWIINLNIYAGILIFLIWIKLFKYLGMTYTLGIFNLTLYKSRKDIFSFTMVFLIFYLGYALAGFLLFGVHAKSFSTFGYSLFTLMKAILGVFDYDEISKVNGYFGALYFVTFIFFVFFLLLNMFMAIINDTFQLLKSNLLMQNRSSEFGHFIRNGTVNILSKCFFTKRLAGLMKTKTTKEKTNIYKVLKQCKYTDAEIQVLFTKYHFNINIDITEQRANKFIRDVIRNNYELHEAADFVRNKKPGTLYMTADDFERQQNQIRQLEEKVKRFNTLLNSMMINY